METLHRLGNPHSSGPSGQTIPTSKHQSFPVAGYSPCARISGEPTIGLVCQSWESAESQTRGEIADLYDPSSIDEDKITFLHYGHFRKALKDANLQGEVERLFLQDLHVGFPSIPIQHLEPIPNGLVADVVYHNIPAERKSGADFGLVVTRPEVEDTGYSLAISTHRQGMLCQAKLKDREGKWRCLTETQVRVLPDKLEFACLGLYSFADEERLEFNPHRWQLCEGHSIDQVTGFLSKGEFPSPIGTQELLTSLGGAHCGTGDAQVIEEHIERKQAPSMEIRISWPDGAEPMEQFCYVDESVHQHVHVRLTE